MDYLPFLLLVGLILFVFFGISYSSQKFKIPSVLAFIIFGILMSSFFTDNKALYLAAEIGIVLLFFLLGLEFPLARMMEISKKIWPAGFLDVILNFGVGVVLALIFKLDLVAGLFIGGVAYATSSSITAKLLEEQKRLANPETEFILALLIFEDLVAPILVSLLAGLSLGQNLTVGLVADLMFKIILLTLGAILIGYYGFRKLNAFISSHLEKDFMPLFAVGIALGYSGLAVMLGLSEVLGAFLAGVMLSETGKSSELEHLVFPIKDITLPFFFFWFGTSISFGEGIPLVGLLTVLVIWSILGKIIVGYYGGKAFGLTPKVSLRAGFSLIQRGEFSAIIASLAVPQLRIFSGIYILITALVGVYFFQKASTYSKWFNKTFFAKG